MDPRPPTVSAPESPPRATTLEKSGPRIIPSKGCNAFATPKRAGGHRFSVLTSRLAIRQNLRRAELLCRSAGPYCGMGEADGEEGCWRELRRQPPGSSPPYRLSLPRGVFARPLRRPRPRGERRAEACRDAFGGRRASVWAHPTVQGMRSAPDHGRSPDGLAADQPDLSRRS